MFSISRTVSMAIITLSLAACATVQAGRDFDALSFEAKVERGITTQEQVRGWFGTPSNTGVSVDTGGDRFDEWTYYFASGRLSDTSVMRMKMLQIKFDKQGLVRGYNWSTSGQ
ncbi:MAG: outer membrane protein assembly factor BamE [Nitrosomonadales bacterium]|nr:outer membrane protein assembly factor BamE [Nitrosomonadales bacterium]